MRELLSTEEEKLIQRFLAAGDQSAFISFVEGQRRWLDPMLRAWTGGDEEAFRDLRQDVIAALYTSLKSWRGAAAPKTFVWRIARNLAATRVRTEKRRRERERRDAVRRRAEDEVRADREDPAERYGEQAEADSVRRALYRLGAEDQAILTLREVGGLSFAEISAIQGVAEQALRVRAFRARRKFELAFKEAQNERCR